MHPQPQPQPVFNESRSKLLILVLEKGKGKLGEPRSKKEPRNKPSGSQVRPRPLGHAHLPQATPTEPPRPFRWAQDHMTQISSRACAIGHFRRRAFHSAMAAPLGGMFSGQAPGAPQPPPGLPGQASLLHATPGAPRTSSSTLVDELESSFEVRPG